MLLRSSDDMLRDDRKVSSDPSPDLRRIHSQSSDRDVCDARRPVGNTVSVILQVNESINPELQLVLPPPYHRQRIERGVQDDFSFFEQYFR